MDDARASRAHFKSHALSCGHACCPQPVLHTSRCAEECPELPRLPLWVDGRQRSVRGLVATRTVTTVTLDTQKDSLPGDSRRRRRSLFVFNGYYRGGAPGPG